MSLTYPTSWRRYITNPVTGNVYKDHEGNYLYRIPGMNNANTYIKRVYDDDGFLQDESVTKYQIAEVINTGNYDNASLLVIGASGHKAGKLHSVKPTDGSGDFTVTGGGNAVSQNSDGTWQINWPANTPRYSWIDGVPSILVESQRQNLITYPRSFGNAYWTKTGATVDDNAGAGYACPFVDASGVKTNEAYKLIATANDATLKLTTPFTTVAASTYVNSLFIKRVAGTGVVSLIDVNDTDRAVTLTSEWQHFEYTAAAGTTGQIGIMLATEGDEVMICHAQPELGASASSPIYGAEGATTTRNADVVNLTTSLNNTYFTNGVTFYFELTPNDTGNVIQTILGLGQTTVSGGGRGFYIIIRSNRWRCGITGDNVNMQFNTLVPVNYNTRYKIIFQYDPAGYLYFYVNGVKYTQNLGGSETAITATHILQIGKGFYDSIKNINSFFYTLSLLSESECIELTTL